jgi:ABC-type dipeptide/oligopeptide/nickel transport system permease component
MRGTDYIIKRTAFALVTIFVAITLNFVIFRAAPGDTVTGERCRNCTKEFKAQLRHELGLDKTKWQQYVIYLKQLGHGDLGYSFKNNLPVGPQLWQPLKNTLPMIALGTAFSIIFGVLTGVIAAWRRGTAVDRISVLGGLGFYSLPTQWLGLMLIFYLAPQVNLPTSGIKDPYLFITDPGWWPAFVDRMKHMILPSLTLGLVLYGEYTLIVRSAMLETLGEDYVLTARAKGLKTWTIVRKHALRNSMLPITTLIFLSLGYIVGGAILIESVFNYPGIGLLTYDAVFEKDYPILQGAFLVLTVSVVVANYIADLLYFRLDPRITE